MNGTTTRTRLSTGRYGDPARVLRAAAGFYAHHGVPHERASGFALHPMADHAVCARWNGESAGPVDPECLEPVASGTVDAWLKRDHPCDPALVRLLNSLTPVQEPPTRPDTDFAGLLAGADALLRERIPELWDATRPFVTRAHLSTEEGFLGGSWDHAAGAVVLGSRLRGRPAAAAESLFHEAVHAKTYRISRGFARVFLDTTKDFIDIPWWRTADSSQLWGTERAFAAFTVYAHLSHYYGRTREISRDPESDDTLDPLRRTAFRARYLGNLILQLDSHWLDDERRDLVRWLFPAIPEPPGLNAAGARALRLDITSFPGAADALRHRN
jgi:hypothetical protein